MEGSRAGRWVWVIAGASAVLQITVGSLRRAPSWDESIYLSQVTRGAAALPFVASRARGITLVVAPFAAAGAPLWLVRLVLVLGTSVVAALVFRLWAPVLGWGAPVAMALFMGSWPVLFYGSEVMPNLWAALFAVGTLAFVTRNGFGQDVRAGDLVGIGLMGGAMALMRPPDAVVLALAASIVILAARGPVRSIVALVAGVALGTLPWLIEMSARYGGPGQAIEAARTVSHLGGVVSGVTEHLRLTDGPLLGPDPGGGVPWMGVLWWAALVVLSVLGCRADPDHRRTLGMRVAAIVGASLAAEYLFLITGLAPRFLLSALATFCVSAGGGLVSLRTRGQLGSRGSAALAVIAIGFFVWQLGTFDRLEAQARGEREVPHAVGLAIGDAVGGGACVVASTDDFAQVAFAARCAGRDLIDLGPSTIASIVDGADGRRVVVASRKADDGMMSGTPIEVPGGGWTVVEVTP